MSRQEQYHPIAFALDGGNNVRDVDAIAHANLERIPKHTATMDAHESWF